MTAVMLPFLASTAFSRASTVCPAGARSGGDMLGGLRLVTDVFHQIDLHSQTAPNHHACDIQLHSVWGEYSRTKCLQDSSKTVVSGSEPLQPRVPVRLSVSCSPLPIVAPSPIRTVLSAWTHPRRHQGR